MQYHEVFIGLNGSPYYCLLTRTYYRSKQSGGLSRDLHPTPPITNPSPPIVFFSESAAFAKVADGHDVTSCLRAASNR